MTPVNNASGQEDFGQRWRSCAMRAQSIWKFLAICVLTIPGTALAAYPTAPTAEVNDDYHGTTVADPYRPLEDPDAPATWAWVEAQNKITFGFLERIPERQAIKDRLTKLWDFEKLYS